MSISCLVFVVRGVCAPFFGCCSLWILGKGGGYESIHCRKLMSWLVDDRKEYRRAKRKG